MMRLQQVGFLKRLRALRMRKELPEKYINKIVGCDVSENAISNFSDNLVLNGLSNLISK